jgi:hypothetical protein
MIHVFNLILLRSRQNLGVPGHVAGNQLLLQISEISVDNLNIVMNTPITQEVDRLKFRLIAQEATGFDSADLIATQVDFPELLVVLKNSFSEFLDFVGLQIDSSQVFAIFEGFISDFHDVVERSSEGL